MSSAAYGKTSGLGKKPEDRFAVPLCAEHHRLAKNAQHHHGEAQWWGELGINPLLVAAQLYAQRGDIVAMTAIVHLAIAGRGKKPT